MATEFVHSISYLERPDLRGRILLGLLWNPNTECLEQVVFRFSEEEGTLNGTFRGGAILFGTFHSRWSNDLLAIDWQCATERGFSRGRTHASVETVPGGRIRVKERWIETPHGERPGFLILEEPMCDDQS